MSLDLDSIGTGGFPLPIISSIEPAKFNHSTTKTVTVKGSYFTQTTTVAVPGLTIGTVTIISDNELTVEVTSGTTDAFFNVEVSNHSGTTIATNGIQVELSTWVDLRAGGDTFTSGNGAGNDIRFRSGMAMSRDATGMSFTGSTPWSSWVKFESLGWTRGDGITLQWIFSQPSSNMMIGIGSTATNETNTAQYQQAEVEAYFSSATNFWGLYGTAGNQGDGVTIGAGTFKLKFENDGGVGQTFTMYQLPSANPSDWDDESNPIKTITIGGSLNPNEASIMPFIIPQNGGTQRFIAIKTE